MASNFYTELCTLYAYKYGALFCCGRILSKWLHVVHVWIFFGITKIGSIASKVTPNGTGKIEHYLTTTNTAKYESCQ